MALLPNGFLFFFFSFGCYFEIYFFFLVLVGAVYFLI